MATNRLYWETRW